MYERKGNDRCVDMYRCSSAPQPTLQEMRKVKSAGSAGQMWLSRSWWSNLFSHQETEVENSAHHPENQSNRTE